MRTRSNLVSSSQGQPEVKRSEKVQRKLSKSGVKSDSTAAFEAQEEKSEPEIMSPTDKSAIDDVNNNVTEKKGTTENEESAPEERKGGLDKSDDCENAKSPIPSDRVETDDETDDKSACNEGRLDGVADESGTADDVINAEMTIANSDTQLSVQETPAVPEEEKETMNDISAVENTPSGVQKHDASEAEAPNSTSPTRPIERNDRKTSPTEKVMTQNPPSENIYQPPPSVSAEDMMSSQLQADFAKSFSAQLYNSFSLLASQAMAKVKQEPSETFRPYDSPDKTLNHGMGMSLPLPLPLPRRSDSRNSERSAMSMEEDFSNNDQQSIQSYSPAPSGGSEPGVQRPPSGLSPKSLALQLRNNDSASMVVSRQQKYPGFRKPFYPGSDSETPPPSFPILSTTSEPHRQQGDLPVVTSSPTTLHHFTTRYTIESPADPSRLGVELLLEHDNNEPVIEVECGGNRGLLYVNKLCQGSKGQSINFNEEWLTPNEFQFISGRETAKDWKRSIRHCGKSLKTLMTKGVLQVHPPVCECHQCRTLHSGSKLLAGKKPPQQKDNSAKKQTKKPLPFNSEVKNQIGDTMMKHGIEGGGLSSIISQLHKAKSFNAADAAETLDLSKKTSREQGCSPEINSRKRPRAESPTDARKMNQSSHNGHPSPAKRQFGRKEEYNHFESHPPFRPTYPFLSTEEQYRRMLALLNRSMSPEANQRQLFDLVQNMDQLGIPAPNFNDLAALSNPLHFDPAYENRAKGKSKSSRGRSNKSDGQDDRGHAFDLTRTPRERSGENLGRRPGYSYGGKSSSSNHDKYKISDRDLASPFPAANGLYRRSDPMNVDQKYIALGSRSRDRAMTNDREDKHSWSSRAPDVGYRRSDQSMIDLNSSGSSLSSRLPDWSAKASWSNERDKGNRKPVDWRSFGQRSNQSQRNGSLHDMYFDNHNILDRIPISKTPVTTLHHRPSPNLPPDSDRFDSPKMNHHYHDGSFTLARHGEMLNENSEKNSVGSKMPLLGLEKGAVPMISLTHSKPERSSNSSSERGVRPRLSNNSDQEMKEIMSVQVPSPRRQSSSAPPPLLSPRDSTSLLRRPTSAQASTNMGGHKSLPPAISAQGGDRQGADCGCRGAESLKSDGHRGTYGGLDFNLNELVKRRNAEIDQAFNTMTHWSVEDVCNFVKKIDVAFEEQIEEFRKLGIDGEALPLINERHLMGLLEIKLGTALKLVARVKRELKIYPQSVACCHFSLLYSETADFPKLSESVRSNSSE